MSCGCTVWPRCGHDVAFQPTIAPPAMRPTTPVPGPNRVAAYLTKRRAIAALWREADALWDGMTTGERIEATRALGDDWRPRR